MDQNLKSSLLVSPIDVESTRNGYKPYIDTQTSKTNSNHDYLTQRMSVEISRNQSKLGSKNITDYYDQVKQQDSHV